MNMCKFGAALLATLTAAIMADASVIFHNTGHTSGWSQVFEEHNGTVETVSNVVYKGSTAIKCRQLYDSGYNGRYHSEVIKNNVKQRGDTGFYGFAFRLSSSWQFVNQTYNIAQFIADFTDSSCEDWMPSSMVWIYGTQLNTRVKHGTLCNQSTTSFNNLASVSRGVWHKIVIQAKWESDNTGYYKMWYDGNKVLEEYNRPTMINEDEWFQMRVGLYASGWYDDGYMAGSQSERQVWFDQIGAGTTFADADPDQW